MTDQTAVRDTLDEYYRAFSTLSIQAILPYLDQPALLVGPLGVLALPMPAAIEPIFGPVLERLGTRGYARSEPASLEVRILGTQSAFATGTAIRYKTDGEELERSGISYLMHKADDDWKIAVMVLHETPRP